MIFGIRAVMEAIDAGKTLDKILLRRDMSSSLGKELLTRLQGTLVPVQRVPVEKLNQYTDKNHQGVIAFLSPIEFHRLEDIVPALYEDGKVPFFVALDGITDMRNFGAIARTCACAGVDALIIPARGAVSVNGDAIKTSAGALHSLPLCKVESLPQALGFLRDSGCSVVAATEHADSVYTSAPLADPLVLVMGAEDVGISEDVLRLCNCRVRIPMSGVIESLNVSVAAGIMMYEVVRQRA
ncbi:MAG: 23S rRNA (guanosine(2251)-2'-O)-methyltransferase RlmB [Paludibacter sp.]|nr:23S rRNA (guanosine(2251)-2'-O)-methyltransferase RlmB [Bacteroidales bacterium]MCM1068868.1 23S rRNA (guanosine(2251)-2'-O)-methyltransferase RlmB [Prevotella sp.]MCM1353129.1 23S rRNA (guanosine(2251)-2'-O)-methyltransferase RlmB [Bacteroides sp.]MCM1442451.1 23S rRNA (guanosine(2251)-2'-O)-methyltransferase RlmB [Muribaculum sp.]MCM1481294.1 23S rRNA (guanosine(2251)-2'-O)-methyltransferase RlmB [Paludibacter sp.]